MDDLDLALLDAWNRAGGKARVERKPTGVITRPLRSWALVLRANDSRLLDHASGFLDEEDRYWVELTGEAVRGLCGWVRISWPGVSPVEAAARFGVNIKTIHAWAKKGLVVVDRYIKPWLRAKEGPVELRSDGQLARGARGEVRVWTRTAVDPNGGVWSPPWGTLREGLAEDVPLDFRQLIRRGTMRLPQGAGLAAWQCPKCAEWAAKVYMPMPVWTIARAMGKDRDDTPPEVRLAEAGGFFCRRCVGLIYESAERTSWGGKTNKRRPSADRRRVAAWDRFVKRISGGVLRGGDVRPLPVNPVSRVPKNRPMA